MTNFELLEQAGYKEFKTTQVPFPWWVNVGARLAFSFAAVEDSDSEWLSARSREAVEGRDFLFYIAPGEAMDSPFPSRILGHLGIDEAPTIQFVVCASR